MSAKSVDAIYMLAGALILVGAIELFIGACFALGG
jgi:hypothetical protein